MHCNSSVFKGIAACFRVNTALKPQVRSWKLKHSLFSGSSEIIINETKQADPKSGDLQVKRAELLPKKKNKKPFTPARTPPVGKPKILNTDHWGTARSLPSPKEHQICQIDRLSASSLTAFISQEIITEGKAQRRNKLHPGSLGKVWILQISLLCWHTAPLNRAVPALSKLSCLHPVPFLHMLQINYQQPLKAEQQTEITDSTLRTKAVLTVHKQKHWK